MQRCTGCRSQLQLGQRVLGRRRQSSATAEERYRARIETHNHVLQTFVHLLPPRQSPSGAPKDSDGKLQGLCVAIKDNIAVRGAPMTCASKMLKDFSPPYEATVVSKLKEQGVTIIGKTNMDEFGMGSSNTYSTFGAALHPKSLEEGPVYVAGGSSGGSAAAVSADMCDFALGSDTGGSVRLPASYNGIYGLKPSYGRLSRFGLVSFASSLDCIGIMSRDIDLSERAYDVMKGHDERDATSIDDEFAVRAEADALGLSDDDLSKVRVGVPSEYFPRELASGIADSLRKTITRLRSLGATVVSVSMPATRYALSTYYVLASAEASSNLAKYDGIQYGHRSVRDREAADKASTPLYAQTRTDGFGQEVQRRLLLGTFALTADAFDNYYLQAQKSRLRIRSDFDRVFRSSNALLVDRTGDDKGVDVLLHPAAIRTAPKLTDCPPYAQKNESDLSAYVQDVLTVPASLAGVPALAIPIDTEEATGMPIGAQLVAQWGHERTLFSIARALSSNAA
ncbi:uncharacterized protein L969DRAFT_15719 [Mixia osmundae IAM 14324]|uniref:Glutamyl-tRNA(Gln) amidotransferase subunit A, mitochondrial n=1 Tax=Mixia osmundae (strain CBS 9802 / IAM 14324 / JCM 22182 / KY 12970) TaxID=764103 RepID=G7DTS2_MIXOS|nr:uncharacterized protein L969DRAFT_15719 [Mixia osmundae IAM 14324]KEI41698.1 hypothetical protein L969DRAFT_15719 [Mixia osmundae IAM 14324]GAA93982.1 hypothetical protein E5Q_00629 [Mixia osmundae IAM 14324]